MLIVIGTILFQKNVEFLSRTNRLWIFFYILYYCFGLLAVGISGFESSILATLIPVVYFVGFHFLLSNKNQFKVFFKVITISFVVSALSTIILYKLNFNLHTGGVYHLDLDRASGLSGDANSAALASIIAYVLFDKFFSTTNIYLRLLKIIILITIFYSLFITFSTTGLFVFAIILFITNYKFFTGIRIILLGAAIVVLYAGIFSLKSQTKDLDLSTAQIYKIDNIINLLTFNLEKVDNSGRGDLIENILPYLYKNPIIGNGVDFSVVMRGHNTYLGVWVDAGVITFLFFLFVLYYFFFKTFSLNLNLRFFAMSILIVLYIFMVSLQSVINQPFLIVLFIFVGYMIDYNKLGKGHLDFLNKTES
ncbi:MAG: O-antigen ligase family protein [Ferruginibacter sp.]